MTDAIKPPRIRVSRRIKQDAVFKVKVKFDHLSVTGLGQVDEGDNPVFNRAGPVIFIRTMLVYYGGELVSRFRMGSAIADNPLFSFKIKATMEAPLKVVFVDNDGQRFETSTDIKFTG